MNGAAQKGLGGSGCLGAGQGNNSEASLKLQQLASRYFEYCSFSLKKQRCANFRFSQNNADNMLTSTTS